ncbi:phosphate propanoyltransferase [Alkalihalobacterium elongatum]|uniref:phosphate propanoyltransferase n=1 Tax=Alkalihalobacterium elongatum TaxID=2675466 RepID=UPI001C1F5FA3|nr:phosphate propanoyltransferase [Alkalihalobacterium elongatum]
MVKHNSHLVIIEEILSQLGKGGHKEEGIPIGVSARHCHLSPETLELLFGKGYQLTKKSDLLQPGQFSANETVTIVGPKGSIQNVRILGPTRKLTQVEVSKTDSIRLGLTPPIRESGNIKGSAPITIVGPKGSIYLSEGLIIAQAHIHMSPIDAEHFGVRDGEFVQVEINNDVRPLRFKKVKIRLSQNAVLEMHVDTDEANASLVKTGEKGRLVKEDKRND